MHTDTPHITRPRTWHAFPTLADGDLIASRAAYWTGMGAILLVALVLRAWNLGGTDLWSDEMHTLLRVRWPLRDMLDSLMYAGNQTPLYYLLLRWLPGESLQFIRWTSVILGLVNVVLLSEIVVYLYRSRTLGLALAALLAVHPMHVILSRTARYYTLLLAVSLIVTLCFLLLLRDQPDRRRRLAIWVVFWLGSMVLYLLHYTALALPATQLVYLLLTRRNHGALLLAWVPVQISAVLPLLAWYGVLVLYWFTPYLNGPASYSFPYLGQQVGLVDFPISVLNVLMGYGGTWHWLLLPGLVAGTVGLVAGTIDAARAWRSDRPRAYWGILNAATLVTLFVLGIALGMQYRDRYAMIALGATLITFGLGVVRWARPLALAALALVVVTSTAITLDLFANGEHERSDWSAVAAHLEAHYAPGDVVIVERELHRDILAEYLGADAPPVQAALALEGKVGDSERNVATLEPEGARRLWVVFRMRHEDFHLQDWEYRDPFTPDLSPTSNWLIPRHDRILSRAVFPGIIVFLVDGDR